MITLEIDKPLGGGTSAPLPRPFWQSPGRIVLALMYMLGLLYSFVSKVTTDHPWLWTLSIVGSVGLVVGLDRFVLWLYTKYSRSIFTHEDRQ